MTTRVLFVWMAALSMPTRGLAYEYPDVNIISAQAPSAVRNAVDALLNAVVSRAERPLGVSMLSDEPGNEIACVHAVDEHEEPVPVRCVSEQHPDGTTFEMAYGALLQRAYESRGAMSASVAQAVRAGDPGERLTVWIWGRELSDSSGPRAGSADATVRSLAENAVAEQAQVLASLCRNEAGCTYVELEGVPAIKVTATKATLARLAFAPSVGAMDLDRGEPELGVASTVYLKTDRFDYMQFPPFRGKGLQGDGQIVAVVDRGKVLDVDLPCLPTHSPAFDTYCLAGDADAHVGTVSSVISGTLPARSLLGSAPNAKLLAVNNFPAATCDPSGQADSNAARVAGVNWAVNSKQARTINYSSAFQMGNFACSQGLDYEAEERWWDYVASHYPYPLVATIAGNAGNLKPVGHSSFNTIVVGGSSDQGDQARNNDTIWSGSNGCNPGSGLELPHVVAPADSVMALFKGDPSAIVSGTSLAGPQVAGLAAALWQGIPTIMFYPEAVKAAIIATADKDVNGVSLVLNDGVDDLDGAGEINAAVAYDLATDGCLDCWNFATPLQTGLNHGQFIATKFDANGVYEDKVLLAPEVPDALQIALVWNVDSTCSSYAAGGNCPNVGPILLGGFDLYVYEVIGNQRTLKAVSSSSFTSTNYRFVRLMNVDTQALYEIDIQRVFMNGSPYFGLAWSNE